MNFEAFQKLPLLTFANTKTHASWVLKHVMSGLIYYADKNMRCFPYIRTLAHKLCMNRETVSSALSELQRLGRVSWETKKNRRHFRIHLDDVSCDPLIGHIEPHILELAFSIEGKASQKCLYICQSLYANEEGYLDISNDKLNEISGLSYSAIKKAKGLAILQGIYTKVTTLVRSGLCFDHRLTQKFLGHNTLSKGHGKDTERPRVGHAYIIRKKEKRIYPPKGSPFKDNSSESKIMMHDVRKRHKFPTNWHAKERELQYAKKYGLDGYALAHDFARYYKADGKRKADWDETFSLWITRNIRGKKPLASHNHLKREDRRDLSTQQEHPQQPAHREFLMSLAFKPLWAPFVGLFKKTFGHRTAQIWLNGDVLFKVEREKEKLCFITQNNFSRDYLKQKFGDWIASYFQQIMAEEIRVIFVTRSAETDDIKQAAQDVMVRVYPHQEDTQHLRNISTQSAKNAKLLQQDEPIAIPYYKKDWALRHGAWYLPDKKTFIACKGTDASIFEGYYVKFGSGLAGFRRHDTQKSVDELPGYDRRDTCASTLFSNHRDPRISERHHRELVAFKEHAYTKFNWKTLKDRLHSISS